MFTGLVQDMGVVRSIEKSGDWRIAIETSMDLSAVALGASIACGGCCLTAVAIEGSVFEVDVSAESLAKTVIRNWAIGQKVNLEPSLKMGDEIGGHLVSGHVDGLAELLSVEAEGESHRLRFRVPDVLKKFIAPKGSVTLDGVSLTVNEVEGDVFGVNIIPHTWDHTTLGLLAAGDAVNIEIDMLARYVARQLEVQG